MVGGRERGELSLAGLPSLLSHEKNHQHDGEERNRTQRERDCQKCLVSLSLKDVAETAKCLSGETEKEERINNGA